MYPKPGSASANSCVSLRIDALDLASLFEGRDDRPVLATVVRTGDVLTIERNGPDGAFDDVGAELDAPPLDEAS
jgi:hypothetical protein